jgi:hypothetical protein
VAADDRGAHLERVPEVAPDHDDLLAARGRARRSAGARSAFTAASLAHQSRSGQWTSDHASAASPVPSASRRSARAPGAPTGSASIPAARTPGIAMAAPPSPAVCASAIAGAPGSSNRGAPAASCVTGARCHGASPNAARHASIASASAARLASLPAARRARRSPAATGAGADHRTTRLGAAGAAMVTS